MFCGSSGRAGVRGWFAARRANWPTEHPRSPSQPVPCGAPASVRRLAARESRVVRRPTAAILLPLRDLVCPRKREVSRSPTERLTYRSGLRGALAVVPTFGVPDGFSEGFERDRMRRLAWPPFQLVGSGEPCLLRRQPFCRLPFLFLLPIRLLPDLATHDEADAPGHKRRENRLRPPLGIDRCSSVKKPLVR